MCTKGAIIMGKIDSDLFLTFFNTYAYVMLLINSNHNTNTLSKNRYTMFSVNGENNENTNN